MILACDPGVTGAFAWLPVANALRVQDMPTTKADNGRTVIDRDGVIRFLRHTQKMGIETLLIEHVWGYEGQGGGAAFSFGHGAGGVEFAAAALGFRIEKAAAVRWKSAMKVPADKKKAIERASEVFPAFVPYWVAIRGNGSEQQRSGRAEAALLALYGEMTLGPQPWVLA